MMFSLPIADLKGNILGRAIYPPVHVSLLCMFMTLGVMVGRGGMVETALLPVPEDKKDHLKIIGLKCYYTGQCNVLGNLLHND